MKTRQFTKDGQMFVLPDAFYRVSIKLIILDDTNRILVLKDLETDRFELPGGGWDHGEDLQQAVGREVVEELGVAMASFDANMVVHCVGLHPNNFYALKMYYRATLESSNFTLEEGFESYFLTRAEFLAAEFPGDEAGILQHADKIWL